jgi:hypothetical protein
MFRKALLILGKCNQKPEVHFPHNKIDSIVLLRILRNQFNCQSYNCQIKSWVQRDMQIMNFTHKLQSKQKLMYTAKNIYIIIVFGDCITQCSFTSTSLLFSMIPSRYYREKKFE